MFLDILCYYFGNYTIYESIYNYFVLITFIMKPITISQFMYIIYIYIITFKYTIMYIIYIKNIILYIYTYYIDNYDEYK